MSLSVKLFARNFRDDFKDILGPSQRQMPTGHRALQAWWCIVVDWWTDRGPNLPESMNFCGRDQLIVLTHPETS